MAVTERERPLHIERPLQGKLCDCLHSERQLRSEQPLHSERPIYIEGMFQSERPFKSERPSQTQSCRLGSRYKLIGRYSKLPLQRESGVLQQRVAVTDEAAVTQ